MTNRSIVSRYMSAAAAVATLAAQVPGADHAHAQQTRVYCATNGLWSPCPPPSTSISVSNANSNVGDNADGIAGSSVYGSPVVAHSYVWGNNAWQRPHVCQSHGWKHITTSTDTLLVVSTGSKVVYVCDYSISFNSTGAAYLESASSGSTTSTATCGSAGLTQIDQAWFGVVGGGMKGPKIFYTGLNTGANSLCINSSASALDISYDYDQY